MRFTLYKALIVLAALILSACGTTLEKNTNAPKPISMDKPAYPFYASKNGISGVVRFQYDVDAQGKVSEMRIIKSVPDHLFDEAVIRAVAKWRFEQNKPAKNLPMTIYMKVAKPALIMDP